MVSFRATQHEFLLRIMELDPELLVKLLFIFGFLFLLWVGQAVIVRFVHTSKEELSIVAFTKIIKLKSHTEHHIIKFISRLWLLNCALNCNYLVLQVSEM